MSGQRFIIDAHTHLYTIDLYTLRPRSADYKALVKRTIDGYLDWLDRFEVHQAAASSLTPMIFRCWKSRHGGNEEVFELMKIRPDRVLGQYVPNVYEGAAAVKEKITEAVEKYGCRGIKIHPWVQGFPANDELVYPVFEKAAEFRLPVLIHSGTAPYCTPLLIADIARKFPDVPVIMGHMGKHELHLDVFPAIRLSENIYLEISGHEVLVTVEQAVREFGARRILFGTDGPSTAFRALVYYVEDMEISNEEKDWIFNRSAREVFGL
ncbi:MAG: amidohydrolase family protein [Acidobacteriota bacterium]|nr:amidohydrolase family protein [Blastocatellia bacterium]MDW8240959.1 amidohydrolase family protein [Acidobacteriota bacterium]